MSAVQGRRRPLVVWVGAGASAWAGYPLWRALAEDMHRRFAREVSTYDKRTAAAILAARSYPKLFQEMHTSEPALYFSCLRDTFSYREPGPVYGRLLKVLGRLRPTCILTTNVDESLEHNLSCIETIQRSDVERIPQLLTEGTAFVAKLHGSISAVESMVFRKQDYDEVIRDVPFLNALRSTFEVSTVVFVGYGLQDKHVLAAIQDNAASHPLFGTGPHFIVAPEGSSGVPEHVRRISYLDDPPDHRSSLLTLEAIAETQVEPSPAVAAPPLGVITEPNRESVYFIGELLPPGSIKTSQTITGTSQRGERELLVGEGYVDGEVVLHDYCALHDVVVGLICFDVICLSIDHLGRLHNLLGSTWFWRFAEAEAVRLVIPPHEPVVVFRERGSPVGDIKAFVLGSRSSTMESFHARTVSERIRQHLKPRPGKEAAAEIQMEMLESSTVDLAHVVTTEGLAEKARSAMMHPAIRRLLGISGGTPLGAVPRWLAFPVLRLAGVVRTGVICQHIQACATRMVLGSERLASVAFSASSGTEWVDDAASYVLTGRFNSDVGALIEQQPALLAGVLRFRESADGKSFRREIAEHLATNAGGQVSAAVNSGLREALAMSTLQSARDQLSGMFMPLAAGPRLQPAVWGDLRNGEARIAGWRKRSRALLDDLCRTNGLNPYDLCPCGSGEKVRFCCRSALR